MLKEHKGHQTPTATTIQFSFELNDNDIQKAVNAFWFSSLVFSIASAVNSLLGQAAFPYHVMFAE